MITTAIPIEMTTVEALAERERLLDEVEHIRVAALELPSLTPEERREVVDRIVDFLQGDLSAHADTEERRFYPFVADALGDWRVAAPMLYDHHAIQKATARLKQTSVHDVPRLQELLYGLHAVITLHFEKEGELYRPFPHGGSVEHHVRRRNGHGDD